MSRKWMPFHCLLTWRGLVKRDTNTNYCLIIITSKTILIERYVYSFKSFFRMTFFRPFVCLRETTRERMFIHFRWKHIMLFPGTEFIFVERWGSFFLDLEDESLEESDEETVLIYNFLSWLESSSQLSSVCLIWHHLHDFIFGSVSLLPLPRTGCWVQTQGITYQFQVNILIVC